MHQVLEDEAERAALTEALLDGRHITDYSIWEIAQLLRLPLSGRTMGIAAECILGKQALPESALCCAPSTSSPRQQLFPDIQVACTSRSRPSANVTRCSNSSKDQPEATDQGRPQFDELTDTAQALRFARVALNARSSKNGGVTISTTLCSPLPP